MSSWEEYLPLYEVQILISLYKLEMQSRKVGKLKNNLKTNGQLNHHHCHEHYPKIAAII